MAPDSIPALGNKPLDPRLPQEEWISFIEEVNPISAQLYALNRERLSSRRRFGISAVFTCGIAFCFPCCYLAEKNRYEERLSDIRRRIEETSDKWRARWEARGVLLGLSLGGLYPRVVVFVDRLPGEKIGGMRG
ncbi:MAG: hypothetical protein ACYCOU_07515 [Sulfobacillus sp.]